MNRVFTQDYGPGTFARSYARTRTTFILISHSIASQARIDELYRTGNAVTEMVDFRVEQTVTIEYEIPEDETDE